MSFKNGETITIHCTDHETDATATVVDFRGDYLRVLIDNKIPMNLQRKDRGSNIFVGTMHGLEFTAIIK
jgi:hypothetical protein